MKLPQVLFEWELASAFLILAVTALRALLGKRVSAGLRYALWALVLVRLLVPVQLFPIFTPAVAVPEPEPVTITAPPALGSAPVLTLEKPTIAEPLPEEMKPYYDNAVPAHSAPQAEPLPIAQALGWLWLAGLAAMAAAFTVSNAGFARRLRRVRVPLERTDRPLPVYIVQGLPSPCLFGLVRPAVYIPPEAADDAVMLRHVLAHEYTHCRHGDHVWNVLRSAALTVHWWNPMVWLAVVLSRRDCELACDEGALKRLGDGERIAYGRTLLALITAAPRPQDLLRCATTMTGGQKNVFDRVTRIARAPKRWLWAAVVAVLAAAMACVCAFGQAAETEPEDGLPPALPASASPAPDETVPVEHTQTINVEPSVLGEGLDFEFIYANTLVSFSNLTYAVTGLTDFTFQVERYVILDLDRDGETELILELGGQGGFQIFHRTEQGLYSYHKVPRGLQELKVDGTYRGSSSASQWGFYATTGFDGHTGYGVLDARFTWCQPAENGDSFEEQYFVDNTPATEQAFNAAAAAQQMKEDAPWQPWVGSPGYPAEVKEWLDAAGVTWLKEGHSNSRTPIPSDLYREVLLGEQDFLLRNDDGDIPLNIAGVPDLFDPYSPYADIDQFAVIDLDGDGTQEVIVHTASVSGDMGGYLLLHQADGQVYGVRFHNPWTFQNLKTDGTYETSDSSGLMHSVESLEIRGEFYLFDGFAWANMSTPSLGEYDTFYVNHKEATREEYEAVMARQAEKPDALWWDFTRINIQILFPY